MDLYLGLSSPYPGDPILSQSAQGSSVRIIPLRYCAIHARREFPPRSRHHFTKFLKGVRDYMNSKNVRVISPFNL